jgi:hypothetical protein
MAGLSDMEELLSRVSNKDLVGYMREALSCYQAGATRGCIVMCYLALFDDLREKLKELAQVNSTAKTIWEAVELRANNQEVFEHFMAESLKAKGLITDAEADALEQVRVRRNKAAHPSGIHASPEEARFVFFEVIDKFLSKQVLKTTHAVDALMDRLSNTNLFPSERMSEVKAIAHYEIQDIHPSALKQLLSKCGNKLDGTDPTLSHNAKSLLLGLSYANRGNEDPDTQKYIIVAKSDNESRASFLAEICAANPKLLSGITDVVRLRMQSLLIKNLEDLDPTTPSTALKHPLLQFKVFAEHLSLPSVIHDYPTWVDQVLSEYRYLPSLVRIVNDDPSLQTQLVNLLIKDAGSTDFGTANKFASNISDLDESLAVFLPSTKAYQMLAAVDYAARRGAWTSGDLRASSFSSIPLIKALALNYDNSGASDRFDILQQEGVNKTVQEFSALLKGEEQEVSELN